MTKLTRELEGKKIRVTTTDGNEFVGTVEDYIFPEDNEPEGVAGIDVKCADEWVGLNETDIRSFELI